MARRLGRQVQHKERREDAKGKELSQLKKENNQLKRQLARATKELAKQGDDLLTREEEAQEAMGTVETVSVPRCESCRSANVKKLQIPGGSTINVCKDCGARKKI